MYEISAVFWGSRAAEGSSIKIISGSIDSMVAIAQAFFPRQRVYKSVCPLILKYVLDEAHHVHVCQPLLMTNHSFAVQMRHHQTQFVIKKLAVGILKDIAHFLPDNRQIFLHNAMLSITIVPW